MMGFAGSSLALFAAAWAVMCVLSSAVVTDAMLRASPEPQAAENEAMPGVPSAEA